MKITTRIQTGQERFYGSTFYQLFSKLITNVEQKILTLDSDFDSLQQLLPTVCQQKRNVFWVFFCLIVYFDKQRRRQIEVLVYKAKVMKDPQWDTFQFGKRNLNTSKMTNSLTSQSSTIYCDSSLKYAFLCRFTSMAIGITAMNIMWLS